MEFHHHLLLLVLLLPFANCDKTVCSNPTNNRKALHNVKKVVQILGRITPTAGFYEYSCDKGGQAVRGVGWCSPEINSMDCGTCIAICYTDSSVVCVWFLHVICHEVIVIASNYYPPSLVLFFHVCSG
ncbi:hypothetical protein KFK09_023152 [Dendrobium nobile]|uniref:Uncharacterized protein n=1 Tax=Dendrobium nobile TaxID=94219 RepID=A0A8T3ALD0_DENNO|nr:hypothetical protein KFK09_023152 [Dendrobium nobile]